MINNYNSEIHEAIKIFIPKLNHLQLGQVHFIANDYFNYDYYKDLKYFMKNLNFKLDCWYYGNRLQLIKKED